MGEDAAPVPRPNDLDRLVDLDWMQKTRDLLLELADQGVECSVTFSSVERPENGRLSMAWHAHREDDDA